MRFNHIDIMIYIINIKDNNTIILSWIITQKMLM